ncbi:MAG: hypothetical protein RL091_2643 [Verrucomicrobiota bacterium]
MTTTPSYRPTTELLDSTSTWLDSPYLAFSSWIETLPLRPRTKGVYKSMFNRYVEWCEDTLHIKFHLTEKGHVTEFLNTVNPNLPEDRRKPMTSRQRRQYLLLIERTFDHLSRIGLQRDNPARQEGRDLAKKFEYGKDEGTVFLDVEERRSLIRYAEERLAFLDLQGDPLEKWHEYRDLALVGTMVGAGLKVALAGGLTLNYIEAAVRQARGDDHGVYMDLAGITRTAYRPLVLPFALPLMRRWLVVYEALRRSPEHVQTLIKLTEEKRLAFPGGRNKGFGSPKSQKPCKNPQLSAVSIFRRTKAVCEAAGIAGRRISAQTLRNTYAAVLIEQGVPDEQLMLYLGLSSMRSIYRLRTAYLNPTGAEQPQPDTDFDQP